MSPVTHCVTAPAGRRHFGRATPDLEAA